VGLLPPTSGFIEIDGKKLNKKYSYLSWQASISHVPQNIFLADTSILRNIAFGINTDEIDINQVKEAAKSSKLEEYIESLPKKYDTNVGERGIQLSGGQRQRIGLARALYKKSKFLILDEATSALDTRTESEIMKSIDAITNDITVIIIAHRLSTIKNCNKVIKLENGKVRFMS